MSVSNDATPLAPQRAVRVAAAEVRRAVSAGGMRAALVLGTALATLSGIGSAVLVRSFAADSEGTILVTLPIEVAAVIAGAWFAIANVAYFARDARTGMLPTSLLLVPNRTRLFLARLMAAGVLGTCAALVTLSLTGAGALLLNGSIPGSLAAAVGGVVIGSLAVAAFALFGYFFATAVPRPTVATVLFLVVVVVVPLVVGIAGYAAPVGIAPLITAASNALPSVLLVKAVGVSTMSTLGAGPVLTGLVGIIAWSLTMGLVAAAVFRRYDG